MSCLSGEFLVKLFILFIIICAIVAIVQIVVPFVMAKMGASLGDWGSVVWRVIKIILIAMACCLLVWFAYELIVCLWSSFGGSLSLSPSHRN